MLSAKVACESTNLVKFHVSSRKSDILHFDGFLLSKSYRVSAKKVQNSYLSWHWRVMQSLKKNWLVVSNMTWRIWWILIQLLKSLKILFDGLFLSKVCKVWATKIQRSYLHDIEQWCKIWINSDLMVPKMAWGVGWTFNKELKSLKNCTLMDSFCPKLFFPFCFS